MESETDSRGREDRKGWGPQGLAYTLVTKSLKIPHVGALQK